MSLSSPSLESASCVQLMMPRLDPIEPASPPHDLVLETRSVTAAGLWDCLVEGSLEVAGHDVDATHASLVLSARQPRHRIATLATNAELLATVLTGCAQKVKALESEIAASTVSLRVTLTLRAFGVCGSVRHAPLALALLAALRSFDRSSSVSLHHLVLRRDAPAGIELRIPRPEAALEPQLTPIEYEVLREVIAGATHDQIAARRERSRRTVANQLQSVSSKLGVSGRFRYISLAVTLSQRRHAGPSVHGELGWRN
jgi:DNA-binding CsgD family transcriptional regulator